MRTKTEYDKIIVRKNRNENKNRADFYFYGPVITSCQLVQPAVGQAVPDANVIRLAMRFCRISSGTA